MAEAVRRLRVSDATNHLTTVIEVEPEGYVSDVIARGLEALNLPRASGEGRLEYRVRHNGRLLPATERLHDVLEDDSVVQLVPEPVAGR